MSTNETKVIKVDDNNIENKDNKNSDNGSEKAKRKFHMPSSLTIVVCVLFAVIILTWIISWTGATYEVDGVSSEVQAMGLLSFGQAMASGFTDAASLIFYLFILGALIEIMLVSGSLEAGISSLVKGFKGKELLLIPLLVCLFSAGGTIYGMQEETLGLFIIIVPTLALAGFDAITGLLVVLLGTTTGFAASTVNPFSVGAAVDAAGVAEVTMGNGLFFRLVWWVILTAIAASAVTGYAWFVRRNPSKSFNKEMKSETDLWLKEISSNSLESKKASKRQIAAVWVFMITFVIMILMFIPWPDLLGFEYADDYVPVGLKWLWGGVAGPGWWYFNELAMLFITSMVIISLILGMGSKKTSEAAWNGAKDMLGVAIIIGVARSIPSIMTSSGMDVWMVDGMSKGLSGLSSLGFLYVIFFMFLVLALLIPSTSGLASITMAPFMGVAASFANTHGIDVAGFTAAVMMMFVLATGIVNMFVPTQAVVMASCQASHVSYGDAMKPAMSFAGIMILITLAAIIPSTMILF